MEKALVIKNLDKSYGDFSLKNLSLTLPRGQVMGFVGENGAGKTTTIKCILDIVHKDAGEVSILGKSMAEDMIGIREQLGVVLAESEFHSMLNLRGVGRILQGIYKNHDGELFRSLCNRFSLPEKKLMKEYSTGMKRKLALIAALSHRPTLLLLDEPTSGLDPVVREEMLDLFMDFMQEEDHAILISNHITSDLDKIADSIAFIHQGRLIFSKGKEELTETMGIIKCGKDAFEALDKSHVLRVRKSAFDVEALIDDLGSDKYLGQGILSQAATTEEIMLFYIRGEEK